VAEKLGRSEFKVSNEWLGKIVFNEVCDEVGDVCKEMVADLFAKLHVPVWNGTCLQKKILSWSSITDRIHCSCNSGNILFHCSGQNTGRPLSSKMTVPTCQTTLCLNFEDHSMFSYSILKLKF